MIDIRRAFCPNPMDTIYLFDRWGNIGSESGLDHLKTARRDPRGSSMPWATSLVRAEAKAWRKLDCHMGLQTTL
jgi:hypothetical protein